MNKYTRLRIRCHSFFSKVLRLSGTALGIRFIIKHIVRRKHHHDVELIWQYDRLFYQYQHYRSENLHQIYADIVNNYTYRLPTQAKDTYSCSMRTIRVCYASCLLGLQNSSLLSTWLLPDISFICNNLEMRHIHPSFNNHLFANYTALILFSSMFNDCSSPQLLKVITRLERILSRKSTILFFEKNPIVLAEGSVFYEILSYRHLFDIACSGYNSHYTAQIRSNILTYLPQRIKRFNVHGSWYIPFVGNLSPDTTHSELIDFLESLTPNTPQTYYKSIWTYNSFFQEYLSKAAESQIL